MWQQLPADVRPMVGRTSGVYGRYPSRLKDTVRSPAGLLTGFEHCPAELRPLSLNNYRPISILCCLSKVLERLIHKQLVQHLNCNNIITLDQSGFRPKHSTSTALIKVTDEWLIDLDDGKYTGAVFVDLQKAFDMVNIQCLLEKLKRVGIKETNLNWFHSYLSDRKIVTCIHNCNSEELPIRQGVPQGSILGPLLFIIFINDLPTIFKSCNIHLYADDTVIYFSHKDPHVVQSTLNRELLILDRWMNLNRLKNNVHAFWK